MQGARVQTGPPSVRLLAHTAEPFATSVASARTCYSPSLLTTAQVTQDQKQRIGRMIWEGGHHTPFQHPTFIFGLENVSRQFAWSFLHSHPFYNSEQSSQRYNVLKEPKAYVPPSLTTAQREVYEGAILLAWDAYFQLEELLLARTQAIMAPLGRIRQMSDKKTASEATKKAAETARYVLPVAAFTSMYHTVSGIELQRYLRMAHTGDCPTETRAVVEALTVLALARCDVGFTLASDDRVLIDVAPAERPIDRVRALWGRELAETLLPLAHREGPLEVRGFAQRPAQARPAGRKGYVLVRGRPVRDPFLLRAGEAGYRSTIAPGDRPSLILFLDLPGDAVDVNVHPAKLEVRFREKFFVEKVVEEAVRRALGSLAAAAPLGAGDSGFGAGDSGLGVRDVWGGAGTPVDLFPGDSRSPSPESRAPRLLQVFDTYILFQTDSGVAIADQHSAHERVLYETVLRQLSGDGAPAQRLLLPLTLELAAPELEAIAANRELLGRVGYEVEPFSGRTVVVHTAPNPHPRFDAARCLQELVADLAGARFGGWANRLERFAATFACRAAIKAGQRLEPEEMRELVQRLLTATLPAHDVHGRPTVVQLPRVELERRFGRS
ncbi:MAG TPA: FAD-dependent thymidylate synthase [Candidatus Thermoplasmatota archaeon]|nr:FAD-dependent thymidylate synthase [Candidatus Thermoplasmatota archaeon]